MRVQAPTFGGGSPDVQVVPVKANSAEPTRTSTLNTTALLLPCGKLLVRTNACFLQITLQVKSE